MKLRFEVDQAEAFRRGYDCPKRIVSIEVNPADLTQAMRESISARLIGTSVHQLYVAPDYHHLKLVFHADADEMLVAPFPTWEGLLEAIRADEARLAPDVQTIERGFELIRRSGVNLSPQVAAQYTTRNASVEGLVALEQFLQSPSSKLTASAPKSPELN